ncbi:MAG: M12 family metallo-peptidase, partial [Crocinitomicaceae bacterium]
MKRPNILSSIFMFLFFASLSFGQQLKPLAYEVQKEHQQKTPFLSIDDLLSVQQNSALKTSVEKEVRDAQLFNYNTTLASEIINNRYQALTFDIELDNELKTIEVVLVKQSFHDYVVSSSSGTTPEMSANRGIHYRGIVLGDENSSLVALSIFKNELIGVISTNDKGDYNIGKLNNHAEHVLYNEEKLESNPTFECLSDLNTIETPTITSGNFTKSNNPEDYCINVYFEVDNEIFISEGSSIPNTEAFVTGLFNQTAAIYQNESITVQISEIFVWDTPDSYDNTDVVNALIQFTNDNPTFNGDLAQLLEFGTHGGSGIAFNIGGLCGNPTALPYAATSLIPDFEIVPLYSRQVKVLTHEMGHNLNSRHTHACVWNGNNTTYDDYGNYFNNGVFDPNSEGATCVDQANPKLNEVPTIMSYFDSREFGTFPMSNGFGDQPGDVVRAKVLSSNCLSLCIPPNCNTVISSFPYNESFETDLGDWEQSTGDDFD